MMEGGPYPSIIYNLIETINGRGTTASSILPYVVLLPKGEEDELWKGLKDAL
ncbi:hypothetical protein Q3V94_05845 [Caloramator sp. CAR-1]|nr:hypothetical protein [Caloramator sp. CAR-1]